MDKSFIFSYLDKEYIVEITYKKVKNIIYKYKDGKFLVSSPRFVSLKLIEKNLIKFAPKLLKRADKPKAEDDNFIYLLGVKINLEEGGKLTFSNGDVINYSSKEDLKNKFIKYYYDILLKRHRYWESLMQINPPYKIRMRKVKTIFGSNSYATKTITYSDKIIHYSMEIVDSLIVHELAHHFVRNHSKLFYDVVIKYCPNYYIYNKKLKRGIYS